MSQFFVANGRRVGADASAARLPTAMAAVAAPADAPAPAESPALADAPGYSPIGIGQPLSLEILTAYVGDLPARFGVAGRPDVLIASGVRTPVTFDAAPRAIHAIVPRVADGTRLEPSAVLPGSPVVYATRALTAGTLLVSFEIAAGTIDRRSIERVAALFPLAAGLPVFAPASMMLLAAGRILTMGSGLLAALLRREPCLSADLDLRFDTPGMPTVAAGMAAVCNDADAAELANCELRVRGAGAEQQIVLAHAGGGAEYRGRAPYLIVSLDGRPRPELDDFARTYATAAMLEKFYRKDPSAEVIALLAAALELYSDLGFRERAQALVRDMEAMRDRTLPEYAAARRMYDACRANIHAEPLRLPEVA